MFSPDNGDLSSLPHDPPPPTSLPPAPCRAAALVRPAGGEAGERTAEYQGLRVTEATWRHFIVSIDLRLGGCR